MYMTSVCFLFIKVSDSLGLVHLVLSLSHLLKVVTDTIPRIILQEIAFRSILKITDNIYKTR